jgi:hypothetical protein
VQVQVSDTGEPTAVLVGSTWLAVTPVRRPWLLDQMWWRSKPVIRTYYQVVLDDGPPITMFLDLTSGQWFRQEFS